MPTEQVTLKELVAKIRYARGWGWSAGTAAEIDAESKLFIEHLRKNLSGRWMRREDYPYHPEVDYLPVRRFATGALFKSTRDVNLKRDPHRQELKIVWEAPYYFEFVEHGTEKMAARHPLRQALNESEEEWNFKRGWLVFSYMWDRPGARSTYYGGINRDYGVKDYME